MMKPGLTIANDFHSSVNDIEVHIVLSPQGAPYCEFVPNDSSCIFMMPGTEFITPGDIIAQEYMMAEGGYAESCPVYFARDIE